MLATYRITKLFIGGILDGLTHTDEVRLDIQVDQPMLRIGWTCRKPCGGSSPYRIVAVARIA
jgi:hypothetical protein